MASEYSPFKQDANAAEGTAIRRELVMHPEHMDDFTLWRAFKSGNEKALITIFNKFTTPMYNYGCKIAREQELVKDMIQDLFIELWTKRSNLGDTDSIKSYLFKSLRRKLIRAKARSVDQLLRFSRADHTIDSNISPSHEFVLITEQMSIEERQRIMKMLQKLTRRQHEAIFLRYFDELNCDQIAAVMDLSKQAVYNLIHHALGELKKA